MERRYAYPVESIPLQCANAECGRPRGSLSEGKIFQFEIVSISVAASDDQAAGAQIDEIPQREKVFFWLCDSCCESATLTLDPVQGLQLVPREVALNRDLPHSARPDLQNR